MNLGKIENNIQGIKLADRHQKSAYHDDFYDHLYDMVKFDLLLDNPQNVSNTNFSMQNYNGLSQFIFENTHIVEDSNPNEIDWELIDNAKDILTERIKKLLGKEKNSETLKPIINFTRDAFENNLMYSMLHPNSNHNPWTHTWNILNNGYLFLASDDKDEIDEFTPKIYKRAKDDSKGNIGIVTKYNTKKFFTGFLIDNRISTQTLVYDYLKKAAVGFQNAKNTTQILKYLELKGRKVSTINLRNFIIYPLKSAAIIGSTSKGYYYIQSQEDLQRTYDFHASKIAGYRRTMNLFEVTGKRKGWTIKT